MITYRVDVYQSWLIGASLLSGRGRHTLSCCDAERQCSLDWERSSNILNEIVFDQALTQTSPEEFTTLAKNPNDIGWWHPSGPNLLTLLDISSASRSPCLRGFTLPCDQLSPRDSLHRSHVTLTWLLLMKNRDLSTGENKLKMQFEYTHH